MQKVKILIFNEDEQAGLRSVLAEAMASKNLPICDNISYLNAKLRNSEAIQVPEDYPNKGSIQAQLKALAAASMKNGGAEFDKEFSSKLNNFLDDPLGKKEKEGAKA